VSQEEAGQLMSEAEVQVKENANVSAVSAQLVKQLIKLVSIQDNMYDLAAIIQGSA
jgi:hypothetical protein